MPNAIGAPPNPTLTLTEPTLAQQLATAVADRLAARDQSDQPVAAVLMPTAADAAQAVLADMPAVVREQTLATVYDLLVETMRDDSQGDTAGEYALRLRDAAKGV